MEQDWKKLDTERLKELYSKEAKELETYSATGAWKQLQEHKRIVTDMAIELYQRLHRTLRFHAMEKPIREIRFN